MRIPMVLLCPLVGLLTLMASCSRPPAHASPITAPPVRNGGSAQHLGQWEQGAVAGPVDPDRRVGAIFLDGGFDAAREFILREFAAAFSELSTLPLIENPKGELQELLQSRSPNAPEYQTNQISGSDHDPMFECAVAHEGTELARGRGKSKKAAESDAALAALKKLRES